MKIYIFFNITLLILNTLVLSVSFLTIYTLAIKQIIMNMNNGKYRIHYYCLNFIVICDYDYCFLNFILFLELFYLGVILFQIYTLTILILYVLLLLILYLLLNCYIINIVCMLWDIKKQLLTRFSLFFFFFSFNLILANYYFSFISLYCLFLFFLSHLQNVKNKVLLQKVLKLSIPSILSIKLVFFLIKNNITFSFLYEIYEKYSFVVKNLLSLFCLY